MYRDYEEYHERLGDILSYEQRIDRGLCIECGEAQATVNGEYCLDCAITCEVEVKCHRCGDTISAGDSTPSDTRYSTDLRFYCVGEEACEERRLNRSAALNLTTRRGAQQQVMA